MGDRIGTERWFFYQDTASLWKWAKLDVFGTVLDHSGCSFDNRDACFEHARGSGYREPPQSDRPRSTYPKSPLHAVQPRNTPVSR